MRRAAAAVLALLAGAGAQSTICDSACQASQNEALLQFFNETGGPYWLAPSALTVRGRSGSLWGTTAPYDNEPSLPPFCGWAGVCPAASCLSSSVQA